MTCCNPSCSYFKPQHLSTHTHGGNIVRGRSNQHGQSIPINYGTIRNSASRNSLAKPPNQPQYIENRPPIISNAPKIVKTYQNVNYQPNMINQRIPQNIIRNPLIQEKTNLNKVQQPKKVVKIQTPTQINTNNKVQIGTQSQSSELMTENQQKVEKPRQEKLIKKPIRSHIQAIYQNNQTHFFCF